MSDQELRATYTVLRHGTDYVDKALTTSSHSLNLILNVIRYLEKDMDRATETSPYTIGVK